MNDTLLENLKILVKDEFGQCSQKLYFETKQLYQQHNIAPPHDYRNCRICELAKEAGL